MATLTRRVGVRHIELIEDSVQQALMSALSTWTTQGPPQQPAAWLYQVAFHDLIGALRRASGRQIILRQAATVEGEEPVGPEAYFAAEVNDDLLRMLFVCCSEDVPRESRLVFALKTLCGFSTAEIALRLFTTQANVHKRLARGRERLAELTVDLETPPLEALAARISGVHDVLYLLFNEGYLSAHEDQAIRRELCDEAIRLTSLLVEHPVGATPESCALLALMHLHAARLPARQDAAGGLLLLEEQDRKLWDRDRVQLGMTWLARAASGQSFSRYHAEAGIAAQHCLAPSFAETHWPEIVDLYSLLEQAAPSPFHTLNKAVAIAEWQGPAAGLSALRGIVSPNWVAGSYLWDAVLSDLHRRAGDLEIATRHRELALAAAPTDAVRALLQRRLCSV